MAVLVALVLVAVALVAAPPGALAQQDPSCGGQAPVPANLVLEAEWGNQNNSAMTVATQGIWAVWWYNEFDHTSSAQTLLSELSDVRCDAIVNFGQQDPPNPAAGRFINVYIHHGADDAFPEGWANGVGTNTAGFPFMTLPAGIEEDSINTSHEGFHVMTYSATSPGYAYAGDSQWFIETSAQWFAASRNATAVNAFLEAASIEANPHLTLWHSFSNEAPGDEISWYYQVRQYGMHTWLSYLSETRGVDRSTIGEGFYNGTSLLPQEYIATEIGLNATRGYFADWAASNVADFDYLQPDQVDRARLEPTLLSDPGTTRPLAGEWDGNGTPSLTRPTAGHEPRGWAYNVVRIDDPDARTYLVRVEGDDMGSEGAASHFQARVVIKSPAGYRSVVVPMVDGLTGELVVDVASTDTQLDLVVASVADHYEGNQHYGYQYFIGDESAAFCDGQIVTIDMNSNGGNGTGTAGNDVILGTNGADEIDGLAGDDVICGGDGDDVIKAGPGDDIAHGELGNDRIFGAQGADSLTGGDGDDVLHGNRGNDMLVGGAGDDRIFGYAHNDTIHGGPGNDRLHGNFGNDEVHGGDGDDSVFGYGDNDQLTGGSGQDLLSGNFGDDVLDGGDDNDVLYGADGDDIVSGGAGDDQVNGNSLNDTLNGGAGNDALDGGIGRDTCNGDAGTDTVTRCEVETGIP